MKISVLLIILSISASISFGDDPARETRAVWITTNYALDWPPKTYDEEKQKDALRNIFEDLSQKYFNTVYFQVRSNGTTCYYSEIEPFSPYFTGVVGKRSSYDPLQYAIELGREFSIEVHAWVNMVRCFSGSDNSFIKHPKHIRNKSPNLTSLVIDENGNKSYWMNPGYYKAQDYLVDILTELSGKYDLDGIQLDFFRYPGKKFPDEKYFRDYGLNMSLDEWRRNNLTLILRKFRDKMDPLNPYIKIGATPIGIRQNLKGAVGWEGYSNAFQDSEKWLEEELVDYLVPQVYWNFDDNPQFDIVSADWVNKSYGKNIIIGLAAYKKDVVPELNKMIQFSREIGAAGISFFRYSFLSESDEYFKRLSLPRMMPWKEEELTLDFIQTELTKKSSNEILIEWEIEKSSLYTRAFILQNEGRPIKLFKPFKDKLILNFANPYKLYYNYKIMSLNRLWHYNAVSDNLEIPVPYLYNLKQSSNISIRPKLIKISDNEMAISVFSTIEQTASINFYTIENRIKQELIDLKQGYNLFPLSEEMKLLSKIIITFNETERREELNFL